MWTSYLTIAYRNLLRHGIFSFINIGGLALGLAAAWMLALYVGNALSYDRYHANADRIFRVAQHAQWDGGTFNGAITPAPYAQAMKADFPEVEDVVRIDAEGGGIFFYDGNQFNVGDALFVDSTFFKVFSAQFIYGDKATALSQPESIVITRSLATRVFRDAARALGKTLIAGQQNFTVTGVIEDVPANSHFTYSALRPMQDNLDASWTNGYLYTYILLRDREDINTLRNKMGGFFEEHMKASMPNMNYQAELQPLTAIHLHSHLDYEIGANGQMSYIYIFSFVGIMILLIASINYMNLSTARSSLRIKETGVRRVVGSRRSELIALFLMESVLITLVAAVVAVLLATLAMPWFQSFTATPVNIWRFGVWQSLFILTAFSTITGLLSGVYPAFFLSGFKLIPALKGQSGDHRGNMTFRRTLVIFQFVITIAMIASSLIIYQQLKYVARKDLGFNKDSVITFHIENQEVRRKADAIRTQLLRSPLVEDVATAGNPIGNNNIGDRTYQVEIEGKMDDKVRQANYFTIDEEYVPTLEISIAAGRNFSRGIISDKDNSVLVNEALVKDAGWDDAVGKKMQTGIDADGKPVLVEVVGVLKDFNIYSLQHKVEPLILQLPRDVNDKDNMYVRLNKADLPAAITFIAGVYKSFDPGAAFNYSFLDENFRRQYEAERMQGNLLLIFTVLAISIACLGLFGLINFTAERRRKEIGVRKVLGSSVAGIVFLLTKDIVVLVLVSVIVASPLAWYAMDHWLQDFAYHIKIHAMVFAVAGTAALIVAMATVGLQAFRSANENPVNSLRSE